MGFETVVGLEVHAELSTNTKAFCSCKVTFGESANTLCCPVCMGLPGALPVLNEKVVEYAVKMGIATNCKINRKSYHERKNYFYPDLTKGYQISQGAVPLCSDGYIMVNGRKIRINRIHIEEDAGKLIHLKDKTAIDYNRAGVPLIEIVTEPDLRSSGEVKEFLEKIREILLYLEISHCKMQEGNLRCDVNVSVRRKGEAKFGERCEMKNINSFSAAVRAVEYEKSRQIEKISKGNAIERETRRWDDECGESLPLRDKESSDDYRYFTDPDLPAIILSDDYINEIKENIPELPSEKRKRYINEFAFTEYDASEIVKIKDFTKILEECVKQGGNPKKIYNWLMGDIARILNDKGSREIPFEPNALVNLSRMVENGEITMAQGKEVLFEMFKGEKSPEEIVKENGFTQLRNEKILREVVKFVLSENEKIVQDYKNGKKNALAFLMGQCMKKTENKGNPKIMNTILKEEIDND